MFWMRNRPQPRGFWRPSSLASRSGVSTSGIGPGRRAVGDAHADPSVVGRRRGRRPAPAGRLRAVLDGVHRRLGDGRLEPLQAARASGPGRATASATRSHRGALVALGALDVNAVELALARPAGPRSSRGVVGLRGARASVTRVMSSSCSQPGPVKACSSSSSRSRSSLPASLAGHRLLQPREAEHLARRRRAPRPARRSTAARRSPGRERPSVSSYIMPGQQAERHARWPAAR